MPRSKVFTVIAIASTMLLTAGVATAQGRHAASRATQLAGSGHAGRVARTVHKLKVVRLDPVRPGKSESASHDEFRGTVDSMPTTGTVGDWVVSGRTVHVTDATVIESKHGTIGVGSTVEVKGMTAADGSITASKIELESHPGSTHPSGFVEFHGTVESMPTTGTVGDWVISGRTVHVTDTTFIESEEGTISVGSTVEVKGVAEADGSITASKIEMESESGDDESHSDGHESGSSSGSRDDSESHSDGHESGSSHSHD